MRRVVLAVWCALMAAALATYIPGRAGSAPVHIDVCYLVYRDEVSRRGSETVVGPLYITFLNDAQQNIDAIDFSVAIEQKHAVIHDVGTFSPGVTVAHQFATFNSKQWAYLPKTQPTCLVTYVKFGDGTIWRSY